MNVFQADISDILENNESFLSVFLTLKIEFTESFRKFNLECQKQTEKTFIILQIVKNVRLKPKLIGKSGHFWHFGE